ncbi:hypothetical protein [Sphingobium nicotianae]|nr:hypothetical protein [Sphingobium nicotianae]
MTPEEQKLIQARQRSRSIVMAVVLFALVMLFFGITIAKMSH